MDISNIVAQLKQELGRIDQAITALHGLGHTTPRRGRPPKTSPARTGRHGARHMSPSARARIAAAKKAWWAKQKGKAAGKPTGTAKKKTVRRGMSPAARKRLSALMKARWEQRKKAQ